MQSDAKDGVNEEICPLCKAFLLFTVGIEGLQLDAAGIQPHLVFPGVRRHFGPVSHQACPHLHTGLLQHPGAGHAVAAVVSGPAERHRRGPLRPVQAFQGRLSHSAGRPLHQAQAGVEVSVDGGLIQPAQLFRCACTHGSSPFRRANSRDYDALLCAIALFYQLPVEISIFPCAF